MSVTKDDTHLSPAEAADFIGVTLRTLVNWRRNRVENNGKHHGPDFVAIGGRICYLRAELARYLDQGDRKDVRFPGKAREGKKREGSAMPLLPLPAKITPPSPR